MPERVHTPGATTIEEVTRRLGVPAGTLLKAYPGRRRRAAASCSCSCAATTASTRSSSPTRSARRSAPPATRRSATGSARPATSARSARTSTSCSTTAVADGGYVVGANEPDHHLRGVEPGRDFAFERADVRSVEAGDTVDGNPITIEPAIEVGNIFKLGTRFSDPLGATYLDEGGNEQLIWMGSYGIGPARIAAAAVEQFADDKGIAWPKALAPWDIEVVALGKAGSDELAAAERLYEELRAAGYEVLLDDRDGGPGREVRRRRAARLPAAADGRAALAEGRRRGGADPPRPRRASRAACRSTGRSRRWPSCGRRSRRTAPRERAGAVEASGASARRTREGGATATARERARVDAAREATAEPSSRRG